MTVKSFKAVLVGSSKVGKTSLLIRYKNDSFLDPNFVVYEGVSTDIKKGDAIYRMHLADTVGGDDSSRSRSFLYVETGVFLLCFAINDLDSYNSILQQWMPEIKPYLVNAPLILVGTKSDLRNGGSIDLQQAKKLQKECDARYYVECSAKDGSGVNDVITTAVAAFKNSSKRKRFKCVVM